MLRNIFSLASTTAATKLPCHSARRNYLRSNPLALIRSQFIRMESNSSSYRPKILITRSDIPLEAIKILEEKCDVDLGPSGHPIKREELKQKIVGKDGLFCLLTDKIDGEILDQGTKLKVIATMSVGYDHMDVEEIKKRGITIGYTPGVLTGASAELTVALTLATVRRLFEANNEIVNGGWRKCAGWSPLWMCGGSLIGATVGIVGMGSIGMAVAKRLVPFEVAKIIYSGRTPKPEASEVSAQFVTFDHLLRESDVIIVTCSLNESTRNLFSTSQFAAMKPSAIFINTSRGGVVDQLALIDALKCGEIAAAGLDVMIPEPLPEEHELTKLGNCVLLPHIASATVQTRTEMAVMTARNIVNALEGKPMPAKL